MPEEPEFQKWLKDILQYILPTDVPCIQEEGAAAVAQWLEHSPSTMLPSWVAFTKHDGAHLQSQDSGV